MPQLIVTLYHPANHFIMAVKQDTLNTLLRVLSSVGFWNSEGPTTYERNIAGTLGSHSSQEFARSTDYEPWLFEMMLEDTQTFISGSNNTEGITLTAEGGEITLMNSKGEILVKIMVK